MRAPRWKDGPRLHAELARVDPATAQRLPPTDSQRIQRALEVYYVSGTPISALQGKRAAAALGRDDCRRADAAGPRRAARSHREAIRCDARRRPGRRAAAPACDLRARSGDAVDAMRRIPPGVAVPGRRDRRAGPARRRHRGHAPARQAPAHVVAARCGRDVRARRLGASSPSSRASAGAGTMQ